MLLDTGSETVIASAENSLSELETQLSSPVMNLHKRSGEKETDVGFLHRFEICGETFICSLITYVHVYHTLTHI